MSPSRRELLRAGGPALSLVVAGGLSGCLSSVPLVGDPPDVRESGEPIERVTPWTTEEEFEGSAFRSLVVGERGGLHLTEKKPHRVWVWNEADRRREFAVEIGDSAADSWFRRTYEFAPGARLVIDLRTPRSYAVTVAAEDRTKTVEVPASRFDCDDSATDVIVRDSEIEKKGVTTFRDCSLL